MKWSDILRTLADTHPRWRAIKKNLETGLGAGLYTVRDLMRFARQYDLRNELRACLDRTAAPEGEISRLWSDVLLKHRFAGPDNPDSGRRTGRRFAALPEVFPCAYPSADGPLGDEPVYRVVEHSALASMIGADNPFWRRDAVADLDIGPDTAGETRPGIATWCQRLGSLPPEERTFHLGDAGSISLRLLWFTRGAEIDVPWDAPASPDVAKTLRDTLGLVHLPTPRYDYRSWLFAVRFSAVVIDRVGHYRPSIMDALDNARFMVPADDHRAETERPWGMTAHLGHIDDPTSSIDGVRERVANKVLEEDFDKGADGPIQFTYLGELEHDRPTIADTLTADETFADRLESR